MKNKPTELFEKAFDTHCGGCLRECLCGRIHFDISDNGWDWEEGELEDLKKKAKEQPDKYIEHNGTIGTMNISGNEIIYDCSCKNAETAEKFIIDNEDKIAEYLNKRAKMLREKADEIEVKNEI